MFTVEEDQSTNIQASNLSDYNEALVNAVYSRPALYDYRIPIKERTSGMIIGLLDRILFLSHPEYHEQNIRDLINVLLKNGYPLNIIFSTINLRIKKLSKRRNIYVNNMFSENDTDVCNERKFFTIPYIDKISEKFYSIANKINQRVAYKSVNLNSVIKLGKDRLKIMDNTGVVYKIDCLKVGTRIKEHQYDIKKHKETDSVLANYPEKKSTYEGRLKSFEPYHEDGVTRQSHSGIIIVILTKDICDNCDNFGSSVLV
ncbi:hypothetical protein ALC57_02616 [Trachymyrmex cornetzi]|uniref:Helix-turn-helix domain-containing protein n=1 Tax=Trachymyrmex cornetzi TaxID=471704 RepID=A0A151JNF1_9HYME|nr:hypothetical protein ALC57_02616 [Trachymyrmex cornetzi]